MTSRLIRSPDSVPSAQARTWRRELCAHERDWPFRIRNFLEVVGASMGLHHDDNFKRLKMLQDADTILADCRDLIAQHGLDVEATRQAIKAMLDEQPVPLRGAT
jgi:heterodisulfide reductase subunit D